MLMAGALMATASQPASAATTYLNVHVVGAGPPAIDMWFKCTVVDGTVTECKQIPPPPPSDTVPLAGGGASSGGPLGPIAWLLMAAGAAFAAQVVTTRRKRAPQLVMPASQAA